MLVWILIVILRGDYNEPSVIMVDNLASKADCERIAQLLKGPENPVSYCVEVKKVKP